MAPPPAGRLHFQIESCLGAGGFGEVYLARMTTPAGLQRQVALKVLQPHVGMDRGAVQRLRDEARMLAALKHRAILGVHDLVELDERLALVTEYVEGQDLSELLDDGAEIPARVAVEVAGEVAGALNAALTAPSPDTGNPLGLVHRDLKPSNIRLSKSGEAKLLDFGIAHTEELDREARTGTGLVVGTIGYLAPDRLNQARVEPPSDVYALGIVLFETLVRRRMFADLDRRTLTRMAADPVVHDLEIRKRLATLPDELPEGVRELLRRMFSYDPDKRPTAAQVEQQCDDLAQALPGPHLRRWARERTWKSPLERWGDLVGSAISVVGVGLERSSESAPPQPGATQVPAASGMPKEDPYATHWNALSDSTPLPQQLPEAVVPDTDAWIAERSARPAWVLPAAVAASLVLAVGLGVWGLGGSAESGSEPVAVQALPEPTAKEPTADEPTADEPTAQEPAAADPAAQEPIAEEPTGAAVAPPAEKPVEKPAQPTRTAASPAAAAPAPTGTLVVAGAIPVQLRSDAGRYGAGSLPAGRYTIHADFGGGWTPAGTATVSDGQAITVSCSSAMMTCQAQPGG